MHRWWRDVAPRSINHTSALQTAVRWAFGRRGIRHVSVGVEHMMRNPTPPRDVAFSRARNGHGHGPAAVIACGTSAGQPQRAERNGTADMQRPAQRARALGVAAGPVSRSRRRGAHVGKRACHGTGAGELLRCWHAWCCCDARGAVWRRLGEMGRRWSGFRRRGRARLSLRAAARKRKCARGDGLPWAG